MRGNTASGHVPVCRNLPRIAAGVARLEFAVSVAVAGVIAAFALDHISNLQVVAQQVVVETNLAQNRTLAALAQARCAVSPAASTASTAPTGRVARVASAPVRKPVTPSMALRKGAASAIELPVPSCP